MNKPKCVKAILCCIILAFSIWFSLTDFQLVLGAESGTTAVGRENPFAEIPRVAQPVSPIAFSSSSEGEIPELFIESVKLKFLNAGTLCATIEGMSSPFGSVSADPKSNSLIICDTKETLAIIMAKLNKIDTITEQTLFLETQTLKFLKADNLKTSLEGMLSQYGSIQVDSSSNSLIICDTKENVDKIIAEIKKADKTPQQIMVEVVIVDVKLEDDTEVGVNWDLLSTDKYDYVYRQNFTTRLGTTVADEGTVANATAFNTTGTGSNFSIISGTIRNVVAMLQEKKDVEIIASPRVMVVSGKTASIESVEEIPYNEITNTSQGGSMSSTEFKKVGVKLIVTAKLTDDNLIFLTVNSEQSVPVGESSTNVPIIDTRSAMSELLLKDGQLVVIGGLRRKEITKETNQVPILGDIPLLGFLFKHTQDVVKNTELIVFLSPHIYKEDEPIPEDAMEKYREIKNRPMPSLGETKKNKDKPVSSSEKEDTEEKIIQESIKSPQENRDVTDGLSS
ncbi:MAG: secretin N-terminal domain-containing protein, partial [Phycisphaerales bacterium]